MRYNYTRNYGIITAEEAVDEQNIAQNQPKKEELLFSWRAPARPFKKRDRNFFTTVAALGVLIGLILFFLEGVLSVAVVAAIVFLVYVLFTVEPEEVEYRITNRGIVLAEKKHLWEEFRRFWFTKRLDSNLLIIETINFPGRLEMVIQEADKAKIREVLEQYLVHEEAAPNFLDRAAAWMSKKIPLEG